MRAIDLSEETLEDLLTYDDLFLDYFNAFLQLPAFPEPLEYDRLVGTFQETSSRLKSSVSRKSREEAGDTRYGISDDERESMLEWSKQHRLPFFLETDLFRELKLLKLLLRTLEDRFQQSSASHKSSQIRGYSRQSESYVSSLSNSADNSANEDDYDDSWNDSGDRYGAVERPSSRAVSLPPALGLARSAKAASTIYSKNSVIHQQDQYQYSQQSRTKKVLFANKKDHTDMTDDSGLPTEKPVQAGGPTRQTTFMSIGEEREDTFLSSEIPGSPVKRQKRDSDVLAAGPSLLSNNQRCISAPVNYKEFLHIPMYSDFADVFMGGEEEPEFNHDYVSYSEDKASEQQTESEMKNLEDKTNMSLQQMKEKLFSSRKGMQEFREFLAGTNGIHLLKFWLDCEAFKDTMEEHDEAVKMAARNQLFRDIQDKYKMSLTADARAQIQKAASSYQLSHTVFIRTQYDILRRVRTYWVPRFILHKEKSHGISSLLETERGPEGHYDDLVDQLSSSFLPAISLVRSLPVDHVLLLRLATSGPWSQLSQGGRKLDARIKSARAVKKWNSEGSVDFKDKLTFSLHADRIAGGPFKSYLSKFEKPQLLSKFLFWEAVADYGAAEDRSADRLLRMNQAWNIYNYYLADGCRYDIALDKASQIAIHSTLSSSTDFVSVSILDGIRSYAVSSLLQPWMLFLKHDVKLFLDAQSARFGPLADRPDITLDRIDLHCSPEDPRICVRKPFLKSRESTASSLETVKRRRTPLSKSAREERRKQMMLRRKQLEKEQRALLKAVREREMLTKQRIVDLNAKSRASGAVNGIDGERGDGEYEDGYFPQSGKTRSILSRDSPFKDGRKSKGKSIIEEKPIDYQEMVSNKTMMSLFKKYLIENDLRDYVNMSNLYHEIEVYYKTDPKPKTKKELQVNFIHKTYVDKNSKKSVKLPEKTLSKLVGDRDRPKTPVFNETQRYVVGQLNPVFKQFFEAQADEFGIDVQALALMPIGELAMRAETDASHAKAMKKAGRTGRKEDDDDAGSPAPSDGTPVPGTVAAAAAKPRRKRQNGRAPHTKEDRVTLMNAFQECLINGKLTIHMLYFWRYLVKHAEEDNNPLIDKDLLFYLEVQKYKEICHKDNDEELVKKKTQAIVDCFFESSVTPPCQIDISSDMCGRIIKNAVKVMQGKEVNTNLFDEAVFLVHKELLPYWAGFQRQYKPPENPTEVPLTKHQKALKKRYEEFKAWVPPKVERVILPSINKPGGQHVKVSSVTYSLTDGLKVKTEASEEPNDSQPPSQNKVTAPNQTKRRQTLLPNPMMTEIHEMRQKI